VAFDDQHPPMHAQTSVTVGHRASWVVERAFDKPHQTRGLYLRQHCRAATNLSIAPEVEGVALSRGLTLSSRDHDRQARPEP
jgi:hypothetical protein